MDKRVGERVDLRDPKSSLDRNLREQIIAFCGTARSPYFYRAHIMSFFSLIRQSYTDVPIIDGDQIDTVAFLAATEDLVKLFGL